jgi:hypothetical protein
VDGGGGRVGGMVDDGVDGGVPEEEGREREERRVKSGG